MVQSFPETILLVVGDGGSEATEIREAAQSSSVAQHIRMEGFQSDPLPYYRAADLLVSPSQVEGLSNVVLEAMACGLPALLHDACGNQEVIDHGETGVVAELGSRESVAKAIKNLLGTPDRLRQFGNRARQKVVASFSLQSMADAYEKTYRKLAAHRHPSRG